MPTLIRISFEVSQSHSENCLKPTSRLLYNRFLAGKSIHAIYTNVVNAINGMEILTERFMSGTVRERPNVCLGKTFINFVLCIPTWVFLEHIKSSRLFILKPVGLALPKILVSQKGRKLVLQKKTLGELIASLPFQLSCCSCHFFIQRCGSILPFLPSPPICPSDSQGGGEGNFTRGGTAHEA